MDTFRVLSVLLVYFAVDFCLPVFQKMITYALKYHILTCLKFYETTYIYQIIFMHFLSHTGLCEKKTLETNFKKYKTDNNQYVNQIKSIT